jgi:hypothetical protein
MAGHGLAWEISTRKEISMRRHAAPFAFVLALCTGCEEAEKVFVDRPPEEHEPTAPQFQADTRTTNDAVIVDVWIMRDEHGPLRDKVWVVAQAAWLDYYTGDDRPTSADLLLRIDPGSHPELLESNPLGTWCSGGEFQVSPTGNPGEWRIQRAPGPNDCTCSWDTDFSFGFGGVFLKVNTPGQWRLDVAPASETPYCDCVGGCSMGLSYVGGTLTVAPEEEPPTEQPQLVSNVRPSEER